MPAAVSTHPPQRQPLNALVPRRTRHSYVPCLARVRRRDSREAGRPERRASRPPRAERGGGEEGRGDRSGRACGRAGTDFLYADCNDFALCAAKNSPPVRSAIALNVSGSAGRTRRPPNGAPGKPPPPKLSEPFGVPSATVYTGIPACFARSAPSSGSRSPRVCTVRERESRRARASACPGGCHGRRQFASPARHACWPSVTAAASASRSQCRKQTTRSCRRLPTRS